MQAMLAESLTAKILYGNDVGFRGGRLRGDDDGATMQALARSQLGLTDNFQLRHQCTFGTICLVRCGRKFLWCLLRF